MRMFILSAVLFFVAGSAQAATLNVVGGQLMGASGVDVGGTLYDVAFADGTCFALFSGCVDVSDFTFQTFADAQLASQALLDQVFLDSVLGNFDSTPNFTNGCEPGGFEGACLAYTPFRVVFDPAFNTFLVAGSSASNQAPAASTPDSVPGVASEFGDLFDLSTQVNGTYAVWSSSVIPEPSTAILLGLGLTGLAGMGRRRNSSV